MSKSKKPSETGKEGVNGDQPSNVVSKDITDQHTDENVCDVSGKDGHKEQEKNAFKPTATKKQFVSCRSILSLILSILLSFSQDCCNMTRISLKRTLPKKREQKRLIPTKRV